MSACTRCQELQRELNAANEDIAEYTESSKELQDELEKELARMETSEKSMRVAMELAQGEVEAWKVREVWSMADCCAVNSVSQAAVDAPFLQHCLAQSRM